MLRKWFYLILSALVALLVGCSNQEIQQTSSKEGGSTSNSSTNASDPQSNGNAQPASGGKKQLKIAWVHMTAGANSEQRAKKGFEDYIKAQGYDWELSVSDSKGSGQTWASNVEDAVQRKVDAIIVSMADLRAGKAALESAQKAGIPVYSIDSGWTPGIEVDITSNNFVMSSKVSSYLTDRLGGQGKIVAFKMAEHHGVRKRGEVLDLVAKENPGIEIIESHNIDYTNFYQDTLQTMEDYLQRYGKDIKAVWAGWDEPAMAAAAAIQAAGFSKEDIIVVGIDGHAPAIEEMKNGSPMVATVAQGFEVMGEKIANYIYEINVNGKPKSEVITSTTVYVDTPLITDANLPGEGVPAYKAPDLYNAK
ncbi:sugar ABC transporter substrate-binding protein [Ammoniphilus sp. 3BR4]|uniref:sugar ABC transporter substrate-binding protein n=1 Tax=Ammoniphilus sp. 3BR4 TaxID=3158265 RepID=UPI0034674B2D